MSPYRWGQDQGCRLIPERNPFSVLATQTSACLMRLASKDSVPVRSNQARKSPVRVFSEILILLFARHLGPLRDREAE